VGVRTLFLSCSDVKIRAGLKRTSGVKMHHFTISQQQLVRHTSTAILIYLHNLTYFDAMASLCKMTVPYLGYRIVEEVYMKYKYNELCCSYTGPTYISIIKMTICILRNSYIKYNVSLISI
jgi:hypothetical protein